MSKIGRMPITIPTGVTIIINNGIITVTGSKATLTFTLPKGINVTVVDDKVIVAQNEKFSIATKAFFGLTRAIIANMVTGVSKGFEKKLELVGVGFRAQIIGRDLQLSLGFSHPVKVSAPEGITFGFAEGIITVSGSDKAVVGNIAAHIRSLRPPEPYKGKGIKYVGERIRRKAGKAAKAVGGK